MELSPKNSRQASLSSLLLTASLAFALVTLLPVSIADPMERCIARNKTYNVGDSLHCDKFWQCSKDGQKQLEKNCHDGFVYNLDTEFCDYPHNVDCTLRPQLQPAQGKHKNCPRLNGFYAFPGSESCSKFFHCLEGSPYEKECPFGVIFDPSKGTCIHPDLSSREDCQAKSVLNFTCPNSINRFRKLRFGDHDRHASPEDCRMFFICTRDGQPRLGGCPQGLVFHEASGQCDSPKNVPGCEKYYGDLDPEELYKKSDDYARKHNATANSNNLDDNQHVSIDKVKSKINNNKQQQSDNN